MLAQRRLEDIMLILIKLGEEDIMLTRFKLEDTILTLFRLGHIMPTRFRLEDITVIPIIPMQLVFHVDIIIRSFLIQNH